MHIGINYTAALRQDAGIGRYTRGLVKALAKLDQTNHYTLLITSDCPKDRLPAFPGNFQIKTLPLSERLLTILWHRLYLPLYVDVWAGPFDLFHSPDFVLPPLRNTPGLLTVHDLSFMMHPDGAVAKLRTWLSKVVPRSIARADHILADSVSTQRDLETVLDVPSEKITVVGAGVEPRFQPIADQAKLAQIRQRYNLPQAFILGLGTLEPRKNFSGLIEAFDRVQAEFPELHLVIGGGKGWLYEPIFEAAKQSPATDRIHLIGFVDDTDLPGLYSLASLFAYPSHYEGFGIPVLEAMACGTAVITADNSSLPEVAGEAALLIPASDTDVLGEGLKKLYVNHSLREAYIAAGLAQVKHYSWDQAARNLLAVYEATSQSAQ